MKISGIVRTFTHESRLIEWLENKNFEAGSPKAFNEWLQTYFNEGNEIEVNGELYNYLDCVELV